MLHPQIGMVFSEHSLFQLRYGIKTASSQDYEALFDLARTSLASYHFLITILGLQSSLSLLYLPHTLSSGVVSTGISSCFECLPIPLWHWEFFCVCSSVQDHFLRETFSVARSFHPSVSPIIIYLYEVNKPFGASLCPQNLTHPIHSKYSKIRWID